MSPNIVSIVILNYNGFIDTIECINSIKNISYSNFNVIVVDNNSNDNSLAKLKEEHPEFIYVENKKNLGFTGGNNRGAEKAFQLSSGYIFFLNNDTIVSPNILEELTLYMDNNPDVGLIGPLTYYFDDKEKIAFAGGNINRNTGLSTYIKKGKKGSDIKENFVQCTFVEGAALFVRANLLRDIGGFNDDYFLTSEESELCIKVHDSGYKLGVLTSCCIWHKVSKTMVSESELSNYFIFRNKLYFVKNNRLDFRISDFLKIFNYYLICILSFSVKKRNYGASKGMITGIIDFILGKTGAGRFSKILQK